MKNFFVYRYYDTGEESAIAQKITKLLN